MSSWVDLEDRVVEFAEAVAELRHMTREQIIEVALQVYADEWELDLPRLWQGD